MGKVKKSSKRRGAAEKKFEPAAIIAALRESRGSVAVASRLLKTNRQTIYNYKDAFPAIADALVATRKNYKEDCQELAKDNHLFRLMAMDGGATAYELSKLEPKPPGVNIDTSKLTEAELVTLKRLLDKARPDGHTELEY